MTIVKCGQCNGSGRVNFGSGQCPGCGGDGNVKVPNPPTNCGQCNGSGRVNFGSGQCPGCRGSGWARG